MSKKTDMTEKEIRAPKSKKTSEEVQPKEREIRWYHFASAFVVLLLFVYALSVFFTRFDPSLVGARANMKFTSSGGCTAGLDNISYATRRFGINNGDMFYLERAEGKIRHVDNESEANFRIDDIGATVKLSVRNQTSDEWVEQERYWEYDYTYSSDNEECKDINKITFEIK